MYCLTSAAISFTLFTIGFSGLSPKETGRTAPALIAVYAVTVLGLSVVLGGGEGKTNINDLKLAYAPPTIEVGGGGSVGRSIDRSTPHTTPHHTTRIHWSIH